MVLSLKTFRGILPEGSSSFLREHQEAPTWLYVFDKDGVPFSFVRNFCFQHPDPTLPQEHFAGTFPDPSVIGNWACQLGVVQKQNNIFDVFFLVAVELFRLICTGVEGPKFAGSIGEKISDFAKRLEAIVVHMILAEKNVEEVSVMVRSFLTAFFCRPVFVQVLVRLKWGGVIAGKGVIRRYVRIFLSSVNSLHSTRTEF